MNQSTAPKKTSKRLTPVCPAAQRYEAEKARFADAGLNPSEYARACLEAARRAGL